MTDNTEYQANLFAADLLIDDEEIEDMVQNEDLDYFGLCSSLNATPELMSFKLYSLIFCIIRHIIECIILHWSHFQLGTMQDDMP